MKIYYPECNMINVTCAIIRNEEEEVLIVQRGEASDHPMKWEFPGGKLLPGETNEECIIREINEELSMEVVICGTLPSVEYDYGHKQIKLIPFICDTLEDMPFLAEHIAYRWISTKELGSVDFSEADIPVAERYKKSVEAEYISDIQPVSESDNDLKIDIDLQSMINNMMSMHEAEWVAVSAIENPAIFRKLIDYSYSSDKRLAFRASWTLSKVCDKYPEMVYSFLIPIIDSLEKLDSESAERSFLRIISISVINTLNKKYHGKLADHCFSRLNSGFSAIAVKVYSMEILYKLALIYPELVNELSASINILQGEGSAGMVARGEMILKKLAEIPINPESSQ